MMWNSFKPRRNKNKTLPAREDDKNEGWSPSKGSWWKGRSVFQKWIPIYHLVLYQNRYFFKLRFDCLQVL
ncbi:MAG: hypothetical protein HRF40_07015 [Nitrososphaera sp.]